MAETGTQFVSSDIARLIEGHGALVIAFRPEAVQVDKEGSTAENHFSARVIGSQFLGAHTQLALDLDGAPVTAILPGEQSRRPGDRVSVSIDPRHVLILSDG